MRFVMLGAGAIGGVVGGQLAKAGFDVLFVDLLETHVEAINRDGLHLRGVHGHHVLSVPAVTDVNAVSLRAGDVVVCSVKSYHTDATMHALRRATPLELPIFCAQNGSPERGDGSPLLPGGARGHGDDRREASRARRGRPHERGAPRLRDLALRPLGRGARGRPGRREDRHSLVHDRGDRRPQVEQDGRQPQQRHFRAARRVGSGGPRRSGGARLDGRRLRRGCPRPARGRHPVRGAAGSRLGRGAHPETSAGPRRA